VGKTAFTEVVVRSADGKKMKTLISETLAPGTYGLSWDGTDERGNPAVSDVCFVRMLSGRESRSYSATRKLILLR